MFLIYLCLFSTIPITLIWFLIFFHVSDLLKGSLISVSADTKGIQFHHWVYVVNFLLRTGCKMDRKKDKLFW